jgi:hypothetical protein
MFVCFVQVIFSDETYIDVRPPVAQYVRRSSTETIRQEHCNAHKPYLQRVMFWGAFCSDGPLALVPLSGTMNGEKYKAILRDHLVPFLEDLPLAEAYCFQQDNAPAHTAHATMHFLGENGVDVIKWPPFSPDLNPIENLWGVIKRKVGKEVITTKNDVLHHALQVWNSLETKNMCRKLSDSMPRRIRMCIKNKGRYIPY